MFQKPFSFDGRIRRTEYGISFIIFLIVAGIVGAMFESGNGIAAIGGVIYIIALWFLWAQGAKRSHDVGNSGWYQLIPLYLLYITFADGVKGVNKYGTNPKEIENQQQNING